jgi:hypothetical protein
MILIYQRVPITYYIKEKKSLLLNRFVSLSANRDNQVQITMLAIHAIAYVAMFHLTWAAVTSLNKDELLRLNKFGVSARENGRIILAGESYILHTTIRFEKWNTAMTEAAQLAAEYIRGITTKFPGTQTNEIKQAVQMIVAVKIQILQIQTYYERQTNAIESQQHPAWNKLLRYRTQTTIPSPSAIPKRAANSYDIETIAQCFDHQAIIQPSITIETATWGTTTEKWTAAAITLNQQIRDMLSGLQQLQLIFEDLRQSKFPQSCITKGTWHSILKLMTFDDTQVNIETDSLLIRLATLATTHIERNSAKDIVLHTILPILPELQLQFILYFVNVAPIPASKQRWHEFNLEKWWAINSDRSYQVQFSDLDKLNEGCITGPELWWCFESFPIEKLDATNCIHKAISGTIAPEPSCFGPKVKTPAIEVIDLTANRYIITAGRASSLKLNCKDVAGTTINPQTIPIPAGNTIYTVKERCSAEIPPFLLPTNWYVPITNGEVTSVVVSNLSDAPEDREETAESYAMTCITSPNENSELTCTATLPVGLADQIVHLRIEPEGQTDPAEKSEIPAADRVAATTTTTTTTTTTPRTQVAKRSPMPVPDLSKLVKDNEDNDKKRKAERKIQARERAKKIEQALDDDDEIELEGQESHTKLPDINLNLDDPETKSILDQLQKAAEKAANKIIGTATERMLAWLGQEFDFGDVLSMTFSLTALSISIVIAMKDWCYNKFCSRSKTVQTRDHEDQFNNWLSRNENTRKQSTKLKRQNESTIRKTKRAAPIPPATHHVSIQRNLKAPDRKPNNSFQQNPRRNPAYEMIPTAPPVTDPMMYTDSNTGSIIIRTFH